MSPHSAWALACALLLAAAPSRAQDKSNGFNSDLPWHSTADIKALDLSTNAKPLLYLFNQPWCGACNRLKTDFQEHGAQLAGLADRFLLVNVGGDDTKQYGDEYQPGGGYIPRILFAEPGGKLRADITNPGGNAQYPHYYTSVGQIKTGMEAALKVLQTSRQGAAEL